MNVYEVAALCVAILCTGAGLLITKRWDRKPARPSIDLCPLCSGTIGWPHTVEGRDVNGHAARYPCRRPFHQATLADRVRRQVDDHPNGPLYLTADEIAQLKTITADPTPTMWKPLDGVVGNWNIGIPVVEIPS